ncbi:MAG: carbohydrate-binding protein [Verrucomicrobiia bacterium]
MTILALGLLGINSVQESLAVSLPYDKTCPVVYDNDDADDMYTDEYLLSLASAGNIALKGMSTSSGGWVEPLFPDIVFNFQWDLSGRGEIIGKALRSGMNHLPTPVVGSSVALVQPGSGVIEDTVPVDTPGARQIIAEAHNATTNKPLVVIMGGPHTTLASAYLLDHSITGTVVMAAQSGGPSENQLQDFNDYADAWSTSIVVQRFRAVLFGPVFNQSALVDKSLLTNLPNTELRRWMIDKSLPHVGLPGGQDHDGPAAITLMRPDYVATAKSKSYGGIVSGNMVLTNNPNGNILIVTAANQSIATTEWWRALSNSAAYGNNPLPPVKVPFNGTAAPVPGTIEAEDFDYGGPGVSYSNLTVKTEDEYTNRYVTTFRVTDSVDFDLANGDAGGYAVAVAKAGEWTAYTVNVAATAQYTIDVRVASKGLGGNFHIEFNGTNVTGALTVPNTGDWQTWQTLTKSNVSLTAGQQVMRIVMDSGGVSNLVGDINYVRIWPAGLNGLNDDPDGDGLSNAQEDTLGTDPLNSAARCALQITQLLDGAVQLSFPSVVRRLYTIEYRDGFGGGTSWQPISNFQSVTGSGSVTNYNDDGSGTGTSSVVAPTRMYRLHVNLPP